MSTTVERTDSIGKGGLVAVEPAKRTLALAAVLLALLIIGAITRPDIFLDPAKFWANELTVLSLASAIGVVTIGMTFVMIGGGIDLSVGALLALATIEAGDTPLEATVTYPPTMASSAISLARLIAQSKGMDDLVELQVPKLIVLQSETVTKENVAKYKPLGFKS